jgi:hypothetical protein
MTSNPYNYSTNWTAKWTVQGACGSSAPSPCSYTVLTGQTYTPNYNDQCTAINAAMVQTSQPTNIYCDNATISSSTSPTPYVQFYNIDMIGSILNTKSTQLNSIINFFDTTTNYRYSFPITFASDSGNQVQGSFSCNPYAIYPNINPSTNDPNGFSIITETTLTYNGTDYTYFNINAGTYSVTVNCLGPAVTMLFPAATLTSNPYEPSTGYTQIAYTQSA